MNLFTCSKQNEFLEGWLFLANQSSKLFERFFNWFDWLDKSRHSKMATSFMDM